MERADNRYLPTMVVADVRCRSRTITEGQRIGMQRAAKAGIAAGADGLIVEVHPHPEKALSDGPQSLTPEMFKSLMEELRKVATAVGRTL